MKKLYAGIGISLVLIIGGFSLTKVRPNVNMANLGKYYYNYGIKSTANIDREIKSFQVISEDETKLKVKIQFKRLDGRINLDEISTYYYNYKSDLGEVNTNSFYNNKYINPENRDKNHKDDKNEYVLTEEKVKFKWSDDLKNITIAKDNMEKVNRNDSSYYNLYIEPLAKDEKIIKEGSFSLEKNRPNGSGGFNSLSGYICGVNGSGTLDLEIERIYK